MIEDVRQKKLGHYFDVHQYRNIIVNLMEMGRWNALVELADAPRENGWEVRISSETAPTLTGFTLLGYMTGFQIKTWSKGVEIWE